MNTAIDFMAFSAIVISFVTLIFVWRLNKEIEKLYHKTQDQEARIDMDLKGYNMLLKEYDTLTSDIDGMKTMISDVSINCSNSINQIRESLASTDIEPTEQACEEPSLKGVEEALKGILDILKEEHEQTLKWRSEAFERQIKPFCEASDNQDDSGDNGESYSDIHSDLNDGFTDEGSTTGEQIDATDILNKYTYRWHFVDENESILDFGLVTGEYYMVVGDDDKEELQSGLGYWNKYKFDMDDGFKMVHPYAFVKMPDPSDVMDIAVGLKLCRS